MRKSLFKTVVAVAALGAVFAMPGCKKQETTADVTPTVTAEITKEPEATNAPTEAPTPEPTAEPTAAPTEAPTPEPTEVPTPMPQKGQHVNQAAAYGSEDKEIILSAANALISSVMTDGENTAKPLFWKATDPDGDGVLYLLGSFHIADNQAFPVHPEIMRAYETADAVAFEFDMLPYLSVQSKALEMYSGYLDPSLKTVDNVLGAELFEKAKAFLTEYNSYAPGYEYYNAYYWNSLVTNIVYQLAGIGEAIGYDMYFDSLAYRDNKKILEFESMEFQNELLQSADERMFIMEIEDALDEEKRNETVQSAIDLYKAWLKGDENALNELIENDYSDPEFLALPEDLQENLKAYNKAMYEDRNNGMAAGMMECIEKGNVTLCIVGTAHYLGETGAVKQLQDAGYIVEQIVLE